MSRGRTDSHTAGAAVDIESLEKEIESLEKKIESLEKMSELKVEDMIRGADYMGSYLVKIVKLKSSQIRRFYDAVKKIEVQAKRKPEQFNREPVLLLKPKLAYATGRLRGRNKSPLGHFQKMIDKAIDKVKDYNDFIRFAQFMESIIAYHRYHGGEE